MLLLDAVVAPFGVAATAFVAFGPVLVAGFLLKKEKRLPCLRFLFFFGGGTMVILCSFVLEHLDAALAWARRNFCVPAMARPGAKDTHGNTAPVAEDHGWVPRWSLPPPLMSQGNSSMRRGPYGVV